MEYEYRLSEDEVAALARSLGRLVGSLFAPWLDTGPHWCLAPSVSVQLGESLLTIAASEYHKPWEDIVKLTAVIEPSPFGAPEGRLDEGRRVMRHPLSQMFVPGGAYPVESVSIYEVVETGENNTIVKTDEGLLFRFESGKQFLIMAFRSIMGGVDCTIDEKRISEFARQGSLRRVIK